MGRIRLLDDVLANQIAAGEVVERPASVVKELLENSVDAGATAITVELAEGGVALLRVVDDGHGMDREDAQLALQRHATSKIKSAGDLNHIRTLGFRGEALPSIASVSRFALRTRQPGDVGAIRLTLQGGRDLEIREAAGPVGTEIRVEDLFFNVPARRKFLKKPNTEASHVQDAVQRLALCYPQVAFRLIKDGRTAFDLPRHPTLLDRVRSIFGKRVTARLASVELDGMPGVDGLIGPPDEARATARHYHTFINGRYVRDRVVMSAIQSAYGGRLERGRHPFVVLRIALPPEALDVNVHPAKTEVRYVDSGGVHRLVSGAIDRTLRTEPWAVEEPEPPPEAADDTARTYRLPASSPPAAAGDDAAGGLAGHRRRIFDAMERITARRAGLGGFSPRTPDRSGAPPAHPQLDLGAQRPLKLRPSSGGPVRAEVFQPRSPSPGPWTGPSDSPFGPPPGLAPPMPSDTSAMPSEMPPGPPLDTGPYRPPEFEAPPEVPLPVLGNRPDLSTMQFGALRLLGPLDGMLICAAADGLLGIDVVESRARIRYDALRRGGERRTLARPRSLELAPEERARLTERLAVLTEMGFTIEPFGGATHVVQSVPGALPDDDAERALRAALAVDIGADADSAGRIAAACVISDESAISPTDARALLHGLDAVKHTPPQPGPLAFVMTTSALRRALR